MKKFLTLTIGLSLSLGVLAQTTGSHELELKPGQIGELQFDPQMLAGEEASDDVAVGRSCAAPNLTEEERAFVQEEMAYILEANDLDINAAAEAGKTFQTVFHVIRNNSGTQGHVTVQQMRWQIRVLNGAFSGTGISFNLRGYRYVNNSSWFGMSLGSAAEAAAKSALHVGNATTLNIYTANPAGSILGWAAFPWDYVSDPTDDGVVLLYSTLPGGTASPFNLGDTGTHEVGHWLGLYHTFQGGCSNPNDFVSDTPAHNVNFGCPPVGTDTCALPGLDPVTNYMNYVDDACMFEFTPGQVTRMMSAITAYR